MCVWGGGGGGVRERERERVYLELLSHFLPIKINLTNILPILIKMVDFKNLAWATSFATWASRKFIYLPYIQGKWEKKLLSYPEMSRLSPNSDFDVLVFSNSIHSDALFYGKNHFFNISISCQLSAVHSHPTCHEAWCTGPCLLIRL